MGVEGSVAEQQGQGRTLGTDGLRAQGRAELGVPCQGLIFWQSPCSAFWPPAPKSHQCSPACCCPPILLVYPDSGCPHAQLPPSCLLVSTRSPVPTSPWHLLDCSHRPSGHQPSRHILQPLRPLPAVPPLPWHPPPPAGPQVPPTHPQPVPTCPLAAGGGHDAGREGLREGLHAPILDLDGEVGLHAVVGSGGGGGGRTGAGAGADGARACGRLGRALLCASAAAAAPRVLSDPRRRGRARSPL